MRASAIVLAFAMLLEAPRPAHACTVVANVPHMLDPGYASDTVAPSAVTASAGVVRSDPDDDGCGGGTATTCSDIAMIGISVAATDDAAPAAKLGYVVHVVGGTPPDRLTGDAMPVQPPVPGRLYFYFSAADRDGFELELEIRARDLNGNLGPPTIVVVGEPGESGCSTSQPATLGGVVLALIALLARRRRRAV
jgi:MYXO-CTERM domain-containing protein